MGRRGLIEVAATQMSNSRTKRPACWTAAGISSASARRSQRIRRLDSRRGERIEAAERRGVLAGVALARDYSNFRRIADFGHQS